MASSVERHQWLEDARIYAGELLSKVSVTVPDKVRVTIGFPSVGGRGKRIGECWNPAASSDAYGEVFISPKLQDSVQILGVLVHELIHAAVGTEAKHGKLFKVPALAVGLVGKMTATEVGPTLKPVLEAWVAKRGPYPAGALSLETRKVQKTYLLKAECETCGYCVRVTQKWVEDVGAPHCPDHGAMTVDGQSEQDPEVVPPELPEPPDMELDDDLITAVEPEPEETDEDLILTGYRVTQDDPEHTRFRCFAEDERAKAEALARQWSKTGKERIATVEAHRDGELVSYKDFHGGLAAPAGEGYPL